MQYQYNSPPQIRNSCGFTLNETSQKGQNNKGFPVQSNKPTQVQRQ